MASATISPAVAVRIRSSFSSLLKTIRIPVSLVAAFSVVILVGTTTVRVQGLDLPVGIAGLLAVAVLLGIYIQCYKHVVVLEHLCGQQDWQRRRDETSAQQHEETQFLLKSESSIFNPFSYTDGQFADYLGLVLVHLPLLVIMILAITDLGVAQRIADDMTSVTPLLENPGAYAQEERDAAMESIGAMQRNAIVMILRSALLVGFFAVFVAFLLRLSRVLGMVNHEDLGKRLLILWGAFALLSVVVGLVLWLVIFRIIAIDAEWMNAWEAFM